jgi:hypothetical protein
MPQTSDSYFYGNNVNRIGHDENSLIISPMPIS